LLPDGAASRVYGWLAPSPSGHQNELDQNPIGFSKSIIKLRRRFYGSEFRKYLMNPFRVLGEKAGMREYYTHLSIIFRQGEVAMFRKSVVLLGLVFYSCTTLSAGSKHKIRVNYIDGTCSPHFAMFRFNFKNRSNQWLSFENMKVEFGSQKQNNEVNIVTGDKLVAWLEASGFQNRPVSKKSNFLYDILGVVDREGILKSAEKIGLLPKTSAIPASSIAKISKKYGSDIFPVGHLLKGNFIVPPDYSIIKWMLVNTENNKTHSYINKVTLDYNVQGKNSRRTLAIRKEDKSSIAECNWQESLKPEKENELDEE
jgi:hypothetical protein